MQSHVYTSFKGESFLSWHEWALSSLSEEDLAIYSSETTSAKKEALYIQWTKEEEIRTHVIMEDNKVIETLSYV